MTGIVFGAEFGDTNHYVGGTVAFAADGKLYFAVGDNGSTEEPGGIVKGGNDGWPLHEGPCTADCSGFMDPVHASPAVEDLDDDAGGVVKMKVAPDGPLFYATYHPGPLYRIVFNSTSHMPIPHASASVTRGVEPLTVQFSSNRSQDLDGDPLSYSWAFGDGTTSDEANPAATTLRAVTETRA